MRLSTLTKQHKYHAKKTVVDGITFDSAAEARRYWELKLMERAGVISNIRRQVPYVLAGPVKLAGEKRKRPAIRYLVDFVYADAERFPDEMVYEDVKGVDTPMSRLKRHLMAATHGIYVRIVR